MHDLPRPQASDFLVFGLWQDFLRKYNRLLVGFTYEQVCICPFCNFTSVSRNSMLWVLYQWSTLIFCKLSLHVAKMIEDPLHYKSRLQIRCQQAPCKHRCLACRHQLLIPFKHEATRKILSRSRPTARQTLCLYIVIIP